MSVLPRVFKALTASSLHFSYTYRQPAPTTKSLGHLPLTCMTNILYLAPSSSPNQIIYQHTSLHSLHTYRIYTFHTIGEWAMIMGYGTVRDAAAQLKWVKATLDYPMPAAFTKLPEIGEEVEKKYVRLLAFVRCKSDEIMRAAFTVGSIGVLCFEQPESKKDTPSGWRYCVLIPFKGKKTQGNLLLEVWRPIDSTTLQPPLFEGEPDGNAETTQIWVFPTTTDLAARRLVNTVNKVMDTDTPDSIMHRFILARDLDEIEDFDNPFEKLTADQERKIAPIIQRLNASQLEAWDYIRQCTCPVALIQGSFGPGKTTFIVAFLEIRYQLSIPAHAATSSSPGLDNLFSRLNKAGPHVGARRGHNENSEQRAVQKWACNKVQTAKG